VAAEDAVGGPMCAFAVHNTLTRRNTETLFTICGSQIFLT